MPGQHDHNRHLLTNYGPSVLLSHIMVDLASWWLSPLIWAIERRCVPLVRLLLNTGDDVNEQDEDGCSLLHYAVLMNDPAMVELLLEQDGIIVDHQNFESQSPLHCAAFLARTGWDPEPIVKLLVAKGASITLRGYCGLTPYEQTGSAAQSEVRRILKPLGDECYVQAKTLRDKGSGQMEG